MEAKPSQARPSEPGRCQTAKILSSATKAAKTLCSAASEWSEVVLDLLYPPVCGACAAPLKVVRDPVQGVLCPDCAEALMPLGPVCCPRCAAPADPTFDPPRGGARPSCSDCRRLGPIFESAAAGWSYGGPLLEAVHCLKYDRQVHLARPLARLMLHGLPPLPQVEVVVPVPTHPKRLRQRGFDHASCMAEEIARRLRLPVLHGALRRARATDPQAGLGVEARLSNQRGSVRAAPGATRRLAGRRVLLVDDVMTSGATANACAEALLLAGARAVTVAVLARAG